MSKLNDPEENLRTIRQMMERATIYRAISGPVALVAGLLATLNSLAHFYLELLPDTDLSDRILGLSWIDSWYGILAIVLVINTFLLWRDARRRNAPLLSPRLRMGLVAIVPPLLAGFLIGLKLSIEAGPDYLSKNSGPIEYLWLLCYGLALTATGTFAPRSIRFLGIAIVVLAVTFWLGNPDVEMLVDVTGLRIPPGALAMLTGFGIFHIIYASCVPWKVANDA